MLLFCNIMDKRALESNEMGTYITQGLIKNMSNSATKMFKNMILGTRAHKYHRESSNPIITSREQLKVKLDDFGKFFGPSGVRIPTDDEIFNECLSSLNKLADSDGRIRSVKTIAFFKNVSARATNL